MVSIIRKARRFHHRSPSALVLPWWRSRTRSASVGCRAQVACQQRQGHGHVPAPRAHRGHRRCGRRPRHRRDSCDVLRQDLARQAAQVQRALESDGGRGMLLDAFGGTGPSSRHRLVLRRPTIWTTSDCIRDGPKALKTVLRWAKSSMTAWSARAIKESGENVFFNDLAERNPRTRLGRGRRLRFR